MKRNAVLIFVQATVREAARFACDAGDLHGRPCVVRIVPALVLGLLEV